MTCSSVTPGQPLTSSQKLGLKLVSFLPGRNKRDVVLAIDLTESVGLNDEGIIRLNNIIRYSLKKGDTVHIIPFASDIYPHSSVIEYRNTEDLNKIIQVFSGYKNESEFSNTDIQLAELSIYRRLAELNQCRLLENKAIKSHSVVWITDAPLHSQAGAKWIETPAESPLRLADSRSSKERKEWLENLPLKMRSQNIDTDKNSNYQLTVVDIEPTVQEFCTPAPGGKETCLVNPYLFKQLWMPSSILVCFLIAIALWSNYLMSLQKKWQLKVNLSGDIEEEETQKLYLRNKEKIKIGDDGLNSINCPGWEEIGYLERQGDRLYLVPILPLYYRGREITKRQTISDRSLRISYQNPENKNKELSINIEIKK